ncbi:MAG: glycosyltransferase family 2 protein [Desulfuromonadaceae bacterium]
MDAPPETSNAPSITVVTVVRNSAERLAETIGSLASVRGCLVRHVIIDGASSDATVEVIRSHADKLHYWISEPDGGIYDAMNKGWAAAPTDSWILFLGAGDRLLSLPGDLSRFSPREVIFGDVRAGNRLFRGTAGFGLTCNNTLHHQALLVHKSLHPEPPFDTRFKVYADFDFNQRLLRQGVRFVYAPDFLSFALPGGVSADKAHLETMRIVRKNYGILWCGAACLYLIFNRLLQNCYGGRR